MVSALILPFQGLTPRVAPDAFVAPGATVIGDVEIAAEASVWFGSIVRGDVHGVRIGPRTNLQDGCIIHVSSAGPGTFLGADVTVGHGCILHACSVNDAAMVGMGATLMDGSVVESGAMLAAGALLTPGKKVPSGELWAGRPARLLRRLEPGEAARILERSAHYVALSRVYLAAGGPETPTGS